MPVDPAIRDMSFDDYLKTITAFTDDTLITAEAEMTELGAVPSRIIDRMSELGLFGITIPRNYSGLGWSMEQQVRLTFEFTRASVVYRSRFSTTIGLCAQAILDNGSAAQKQDLLPSMADGRLVASFALTEEGAGSDASAVSTVAVEDGGSVRISGTKRYITNAAWADLFLVFAQHRRNGQELGLSTFIIPATAPGVTARPAERMNGHEAAPVGDIEFDDVLVRQDALLGQPGTGMKAALRGINHARTHVAATAVGQGTRLIEEAARYALGRRQFEERIADFGAVETMLGASYAELAAARALTLECAQSFDQGPIPHHQIGAAKYFATEAVGRIADRAVQILGGQGIVGDHPVPRLWRDVRALRIYEGSSQIHERNLARLVKARSSSNEPLWD